MTLRKYVWMGAAAGALVIAAQASAADLNGGFKDSPRAFQAPMWTGLYLGVNGGYAWRQTDDQFSYLSRRWICIQPLAALVPMAVSAAVKLAIVGRVSLACSYSLPALRLISRARTSKAAAPPRALPRSVGR